MALYVSANNARSIGRVDFLPACIQTAQMVKQPTDGRTQRAATILVVDDDEIVLVYLSHLVAAAGYDVVTASSAEGALIALERDSVRIVILDIIMPGMDGLALCRTIRSQSYSDYVYLMLHTSKTSDADILDGLAAGADDYVGKGTSRHLMIEHIRTAQRVVSLKRSL
jgi:DNA-binding response OmpR family regulator